MEKMSANYFQIRNHLGSQGSEIFRENDEGHTCPKPKAEGEMSTSENARERRVLQLLRPINNKLLYNFLWNL